MTLISRLKAAKQKANKMILSAFLSFFLKFINENKPLTTC